MKPARNHKAKKTADTPPAGPRGPEPWWTMPEKRERFLQTYRLTGNLQASCKKAGFCRMRWYSCREIAETGTHYGAPVAEYKRLAAVETVDEWKRIQQQLEDEIRDAAPVTIRNAVTGQLVSRKTVSKYEIAYVETDGGGSVPVKRLVERVVTEETSTPSWQAAFRALEALDAEKWARKEAAVKRTAESLTPEQLNALIAACTDTEKAEIMSGNDATFQAVCRRIGL